MNRKLEFLEKKGYWYNNKNNYLLKYIGLFIHVFITVMACFGPADKGAAQMTRKPVRLDNALLKISETMHKVPPTELKHIEDYNTFFIIPAISDDTLTQCFSTHLPIEKRVQRVVRMESSIRRY